MTRDKGDLFGIDVWGVEADVLFVKANAGSESLFEP
jgi:hypothetical protein